MFPTTAQLLTFDFAALGGNEGSASSNYNAANVSPSTISRGSGITAQIGPGRFNSIAFTATTTVDLTDYLGFTVTPNLSMITINSIILQSDRSSQGPTKFVIRTSQDGYVVNATNIVTINSTSVVTNTFTFTTPITTTSPVTIRLYGYENGSSQTGDFGPGNGAGNDIIVNGSLVLLPVKIADVKSAKKLENIEIDFTNFTESDVVNYTIERSANGNQFTSLAQLNPVRNDGGKAAYSFIDTHPINGENFYRIRSLEVNGNIFYSIIVKVSTFIFNDGITIYPNPVNNNRLSFKIAGLPAGIYLLTITNAAAQTIYHRSVTHNGGSFGLTINLAGVKKGSYYLHLADAVQLQKKFMVQ